MKVIHVDYLWVDGFETPMIRSKTKVINLEQEEDGTVQLELAVWNFDGSSTGQATTGNSEMKLMPVRVYQVSPSQYMVLCEVCNMDRTPHKTNHRAVLRKFLKENPEKNMWVGVEQEYFLTAENKNVFWPDAGGEPINSPQYYCSAGGNKVKNRSLVRKHADVCQIMGVKIVGYNAEVAPGQWEYQCFADDALRACDDLWVSRYMISLMAEEEGLGIEWAPHDGWNGSGCHTNFSTEKMRLGEGAESSFHSILKKMEDRHLESMDCYGTGNKDRLVGAYETAHWSEFSFGIADRAASVRIPTVTAENGFAGYLEDRRPASNCDPYRVVNELVRCVQIKNNAKIYKRIN